MSCTDFVVQKCLNRMMLLTKHQKIKIMLSGSSYKIAKEFNRKYGTSITHNTVVKLFVKFKKAGSVEDHRSGRPCIATNENTIAKFLNVVIKSSPKSTLRLCVKLGLLNQISLAF